MEPTPITMSPEQRDQARKYACAAGYADVEQMDDARLTKIMKSISDECAQYGCD